MFPSNHDDRVLYRYLRDERAKGALRSFLRAAWSRIADYEAKGNVDWSAVKATFKKAAALFQLDQEEATDLSAPVAPWSVFLAYYFRVKEQPLPSPLPDLLQDKYLGRSVLDLARKRDDEALFRAMNAVYKDRLYHVFERNYRDCGVAFADVYQEAFVGLLAREPDWERRHSAQLYSSLHQIFFNKVIDALHQEERHRFSKDIPREEGNNPPGFTDSVIERYLLNVRFGTDDEVELLRKALRQLKAECQTLLRLRFYRGLRYREIGEQLDYSTDSVGTRISRCVDALRKVMFP